VNVSVSFFFQSCIDPILILSSFYFIQQMHNEIVQEKC